MKRELKAYLKRKGQSQRAFAAELGISHTLVSRWINGHRKPARELIPAVTALTGIPIERML